MVAAGQFNKEYRAAQFRGLPLPILWVAEYFTLDGEGIRWGRHYRQAGWYTHILLWLAFPLWILTNVMFFVVLRYGAYFMCLTGLSMVTANIIWVTHRNVLDLKIQFTESESLEFSYGVSFWFCLSVGIGSLVLSVVIFLMDKRFPAAIALFFGVDVIQDSESIQVEGEPAGGTTVNDRESCSTVPFDKGNIGDTPTGDIPMDIYSNSDGAHNHPPPRKALHIQILPKAKRSFKTGEFRLTKRLQRPRRREPPSDFASLSTTSASASGVSLQLQDFRTNSHANTNNSEESVYINTTGSQ